MKLLTGIDLICHQTIYCLVIVISILKLSASCSEFQKSTAYIKKMPPGLNIPENRKKKMGFASHALQIDSNPS